jgi:hypothetical protein
MMLGSLGRFELLQAWKSEVLQQVAQPVRYKEYLGTIGD